MTKAEEFKTSPETQHLGGRKIQPNAWESPGFQSRGPSAGPYAASMHVYAWNEGLLDVIYNILKVSKWNPCEQQRQEYILLEKES